MAVAAAAIVPTPVEARSREAAPSIGTIRVAELPPEGRRVLAAIRAGGPYAFARDGVTFGNRERLLPQRARGYYAEYTVPTPGEKTRGARRIIAGRGDTGDFRTSNEYYYTNDHYQSFRRIVQ
jgi:ribonuclease T1